MSRSYKKHPWATDNHKGKKYLKKVANKRVRKFNRELANGNAYRRLYPTYDICDYKFFCTFIDALKELNRKIDEIENEKQYWKEWYKYYRRK